VKMPCNLSDIQILWPDHNRFAGRHSLLAHLRGAGGMALDKFLLLAALDERKVTRDLL
jgi:hypothetical protein